MDRLAVGAIILGLVLVVLSACTYVDIEDGAVACGSGGCPAGLSCGFDGLCYRDPPAPPAPVDAGLPEEFHDGATPVGSDADTCAAGVPPEACDALLPMRALPTIDGVPECGVALRPLEPAGWTGEQALPPEVRALFGVAWHPEGLYFYVRVTDSNVLPAYEGEPAWFGDGVEVYVDDDGAYVEPPRYDEPGSRQMIVVAPAPESVQSARGEVWAQQLLGPWTSPLYGTFSNADGYAFEAFATASDLGIEDWRLAGGNRVGLNLAVNVSTAERTDTGQGTRMGQFFLRVDPEDGSLPYEDVSAFCHPVLLSNEP